MTDFIIVAVVIFLLVSLLWTRVKNTRKMEKSDKEHEERMAEFDKEWETVKKFMDSSKPDDDWWKGEKDES